jgi:hypothetical protein
MRRLRLGIILIIISWLPFAQVALYIAHSNNKLSSESASSEFRLAVWGVQVVIGLVGLWLVGELAIKEAKAAGWKHTPKRLWELFSAKA